MGAVDIPPFTAFASVCFGRSNCTTTMQLPINGCSTRVPRCTSILCPTGMVNGILLCAPHRPGRGAAFLARPPWKTYTHGDIEGAQRIPSDTAHCMSAFEETAAPLTPISWRCRGSEVALHLQAVTGETDVVPCGTT